MRTASDPPRRGTAVRYLQRPEGDLAYDVAGDGPLVICAPGMGDVRSVYRSLTPALVAAGYRVATVDLRGHGDSATSFTRYDDVAVAQDLLALADELAPPDLAAHQAEIARSLRRPGAWDAFLTTTRTSHRAVEERLGEVVCPTLVVMGTADPDFARPADEAALVAERLGGEVALVSGAGHYPQAEAPTLVAREILRFLGPGPERA